MRDFNLKISPRMLELLSRDLYTNMYFVLAELIANAYDADAENVYIFINEKEIRVEDDGNGMSEDELDAGYLLIGGESRNGEATARSKYKKRLKMGRKGVGKLAALSISNGFEIITIQNKKAIGLFIPNKIDRENEKLRQLTDSDYSLYRISERGTAVIMNRPNVTIPKLQSTICNNLSKIFPNNIDDFKIHIIFKGKEETLIPDEKDALDKLATFISIGEEKKYLLDYLPTDTVNLQTSSLEMIEEEVSMYNNEGELSSIILRIYGWIGTYKSTKGMKKEMNEFSDNYLAVFAHNKMGQRNILDFVSKNRVYESYIVGNLYIDAFEHSDFPDMAGTNRQGYNESDKRWAIALKHIRELTDTIVKLHEEYAKLTRFNKDAEKNRKKEENEKLLQNKLEEATKKMKRNLSEKLKDRNANVDSIVSNEIEEMKPVLGFKSTVDADKKKIMISQTLMDKPVADIIYFMLLYNNIPKEDIIYSNGSDPETNLPEKDIYGYLQKFLINSVSSQKIYVLFVTSNNVLNVDPENPAVSWGELMEIGAVWVTQHDHWIFNIDGFQPQSPLNTEDKWVTIKIKHGENGESILSLTEPAINSF